MADVHQEYIEKHLIPEILTKLKNEELISFKAEHSTGIDGFMSTLYNIELNTKTEEGEKHRLLLVKFMRGDAEFREASKSYTQFANEIYIYSKVLPAFQTLLEDSKLNTIKITDWVPMSFKAAFGYIEGLSSHKTERECVLALENLKPLGYQSGPRLTLNVDHLKAMCKPLAEYHACSYALKALNATEFEHLKMGIVTLPFINDSDPLDATKNLYRILYRLAFDRFYGFYDRKINTNTFDRKSAKDLKLIDNLTKLREKYFHDPAALMERFRVKIEEQEDDEKFAAILHGDYNRNNVLFKYKSSKGKDGQHLVEDVKMIDFQELRFASPALDLSFFMYFNSSAEIRSDNWLDILDTYHKIMFTTLMDILKGAELPNEEILKITQHYSVEKFRRHFARFAFYGAMICFHFLTWMLCSEEECTRLSELFASDMYGEEFRKLSIEAGGDKVDEHMVEVLRHASEMGYMEDL